MKKIELYVNGKLVGSNLYHCRCVPPNYLMIIMGLVRNKYENKQCVVVADGIIIHETNK